MKSFWTKAALGAAAIVSASIAQAAVIDFEHVNTSGAVLPPLVLDGDFLTQGTATQGSFTFGIYDVHNASPFPDYSLVGALANGGDASTCLDGVCPRGNTSNFLETVNDGVFFLNHGGAKLTLNSFDAAFLAPSGVTIGSGTAAYLAVESDRSDGTYAVGIFALNGPTAGNTSFASYLIQNASIIGGTGTLTSGDVTSIYAYAYYCNNGSCNFGTSDRGQFALDNLSISAVPEPSSWLLLAAGLGALGVASRRRRTAA